jgi:2-dehydro-3-deoxygluconokinase
MVTVVAFGECMAELRPLGDGRWQQGFAGDSFNTAAYLRRLDRERKHSIEYACGLGDDPFAKQMVDAWKSEGVGHHYSMLVPGRSTGLYAISVDSRGERRFSYWRDTSAARAYLSGAVAPLEESAESIDVLYITGISLGILEPGGIDRLLEVCRRVRERGGMVVFDNNFRPRQWRSASQAWQAMKRFVGQCDIALLTLDDQLLLCETTNEPHVIDMSLDLPIKEVVIKRGGEPTIVRDSNGHQVTVDVTRVTPIDTTAAGDSFGAGYLYGRLQGATSEMAAKLGNALAVRVIQHPGALMPAISLESDVEFWQLRSRFAPIHNTAWARGQTV